LALEFLSQKIGVCSYVDDGGGGGAGG